MQNFNNVSSILLLIMIGVYFELTLHAIASFGYSVLSGHNINYLIYLKDVLTFL